MEVHKECMEVQKENCSETPSLSWLEFYLWSKLLVGLDLDQHIQLTK